MNTNKYIEFPKEIKNNIETIKFLNNLLSDKEKKIYYNMKEIIFFESAIIPYFHSINLLLFQTHEKIYYNEINKEIEIFFQKNKYSKFFNKDLGILVDNFKTMIEFTILEKQDENGVGFDKIKQVLKEKNLIDFDDILLSYLISLLGELTNNCHEHGETKYAYFCGQYYPKLKRLSFATTNLGVTIEERVRKKNPSFSNYNCFNWIFEDGTTTREDDTNGGQGLAILKTVVQMLGGKITVISGKSVYCINNRGIESYEELEYLYRGTTFIIDIFKK